MNTEPIKHATFSVERTYSADAARVFRAFSDTDVKRRWFAEGEDWQVEEFTADFRPAGYETSRNGLAECTPGRRRIRRDRRLPAIRLRTCLRCARPSPAASECCHRGRPAMRT
jgi:hypothetical protein